MLFKRLIKLFTSLRLTVVLLAFSIVVVWVGTVAQADEGLYTAQARYFKHWFVMGITLFGHHLPVPLPGGYLLGTLLLINLVAAHIARFQFTWKKLGIHIAHTGVILLLVGQLATDLFSRETQIRFAEGETKSYAESPSDYELVFVTRADDQSDEEIVVSDRRLAEGGEIRHAQLPFTVRVKQFWKNSDPTFRAPMTPHGPPLATNGIAASFDFQPLPESKEMNKKNIPTALVEINAPGGPAGDWVVSGWAGDEFMVSILRDHYTAQMGAQMGQSIVGRMVQPQTVEAGGRQFAFTLRPARVYHPFSLTLLKATHSVYQGTITAQNPEGIPKDFRSRVRLRNARTGEDREVEIFMNSPLRYAGLTFFQYQMGAGEMTRRSGEAPWSVLQVVRNPSWLTPYVGCILVACGLVVQFMMHLVGFISKRRSPVGRVALRAPSAPGDLPTARSERRALPGRAQPTTQDH